MKNFLAFPLAIVAGLILLAMIPGGAYLAWWDWIRIRRKQDREIWRRVAGFIAACGCTAQLAVLLVWNVHKGANLSFGQELDWLSECARPGLLISLCTLLLAIGSRGRCRLAAIACSIGTTMVWMFTGMGV
jgi:hypothetical protein